MSAIALSDDAPLPARVEPPPMGGIEIEAVLTRRERDRQGDLVEPGGLDFSRFVDNPVVLWAHDLGRPPIGRIRRIAATPEEITASVQFADTPAGREIGRLYAEGFLRGWSLGFIPRRWQALACDAPLPPPLSANAMHLACNASDAAARSAAPAAASLKRLGTPSPGSGTFASVWRKRWPGVAADDATLCSGNPVRETMTETATLAGWHVLEAEVVEVSAVPVPANPAALAKALPGLRHRGLQRYFAKRLVDGWIPDPLRDPRISLEQLLGLAVRLIDRLGGTSRA